MKLTNTHNMKRKAGMTLLELTVVILVLLSLISILFIGARAWKKGSDRSASILTIRNVQQAVRSFANMNGVAEGGAISPSGDLFGTGKFMQNNPTAGLHPGGAGLLYAYSDGSGALIPAVGTLYMGVTGSATSDATPASYYMPDPLKISDW